jgi:hypothetical protein
MARSAAVPEMRDGVVAGGAAGSAHSVSRPPRGGDLTHVSLAAFGRSQIKTARLLLHSKQVGSVVGQIEQVAATEGGFVDSENTSTNTHGLVVSSSITIRVPVDDFEAAVTEVAGLAQLASKRTTTQDVTGQVADVDSRVQSARDAIAQLRVLFDRATKLGNIITLESQLSEREADLEALLAQQRALSDQTSLSTISVTVTRPPKPAVTTTKHEDDTSGFTGGLRQGWDALVSAAAATAHVIGAVLPLGIVIAALGLLVWAFIRRLPRRRAGMSG